uniref:Hydrophobin n=1 Tax=Paxillus involutus TaxID=71150 RepID=A9X668_PAXIN|nr:hydrophobin [Paxillus involutus]
MFTRVFTVVSVAALAIAGAAPTSQCNTGTTQCCNNVQSASSMNQLLSAVGFVNVLAGLTGNVGTDCTPITAVGTGSGADCTAQPVCCTDNTFNGLINIGCTPININA